VVGYSKEVVVHSITLEGDQTSSKETSPKLMRKWSDHPSRLMGMAYYHFGVINCPKNLEG
jgi:hypothetical protein